VGVAVVGLARDGVTPFTGTIERCLLIAFYAWIAIGAVLWIATRYYQGRMRTLFPVRRYLGWHPNLFDMEF
jgi:hypothetical protein